MNETAFLVKEAKAIGIMPVIEPVMNVVALQVEDAADVREALMKRGWHVSITREPKALRIIVMPHMKRENLRMFVNDLDEIVNRTKKGTELVQ
jgi:tyrosine decarboxylase/aspartate 1-decarboxylase